MTQMNKRVPHVSSARRIGQVAVAAGMVLLAAAGCKREDSAKGPAGPGGPPPVLVTTAEVASRDVPVYLDEIGKCVPFQSVSIKPQVSGVIQKIHFVDGSDVKKDQVLFDIDPAPYQAALNQATAQLSQAKATQSFAKVDFNRIKDLPRSVEPQSDYDAKQSAIEVADAQVEAAQAAIMAAKVNLEYCKITSPIDGLTGQRLIDQGNVVIANNPMGASAAMVTIQQLDPIYADFTVTENDLKLVRLNMAKGTLKTEVRLPQDKKTHDGELSFLDNMVQDGTGTIRLRATIKNKDRHFWPGQFVFVRLVLEVQKGATLIPTSAVQVGQQGQFVYVFKPDSTADLRPVVLGQPQGDWVVVEKGVAAGEKVVASGQMMAYPGAHLVDQPATAPTDSSASPPATTGPSTGPSTEATTVPSTLPTTGPANKGGQP